VRRCYQEQLAKQPGLGGKFTYAITTDAHGKVTAVRPVTPTSSPELDACVAKVISGITFSGGPTTMRFPFMFTSR
jgi:outer membrane biosynthesis protein TonB